ncbi:rod shape-determining protein MreD [Liquorilactobacillus oeni]|uniref:Rod shape-determining protein MreD n=1 Tax=Liquorilactobacillus oeni DSM 19972 TaxID=1423777 RepID=A0A0R1M8E7_9LACO|nr:rod shape-determining protein MreD [Liquorilactobacillus oeni]KRL04201.1 rod shape-determining protein MreD [Liquorilactobacillus oeni DSM 19972]
MRIPKMRYFFPLGLFFTLFLDGALSNAFSKQMFTLSFSIESRIFILWLVMCVCFTDLNRPYLWAICVGLVFDLYYTGIIGPFTMIVPLIVYLTKTMYSFFKPSFIVVLLIYLIDITLVTFLFYLINAMIGFTNSSMADFISMTLGPTLAYNLAVFVVLYIPVQRFIETFSR